MSESKVTLDYDNVYLVASGAQGQGSGKIKFAAGGIGYKEAGTGQITTIKAEEFERLVWLRAAREYQMRFYVKEGNCVKFDGFNKDAFDELKEFVERFYQLPLEHKEMALKGWNWGEVDIKGNMCEFLVGGKDAFELPLSEVSNAVVPAKNEVSIEFAQTEKNKRLDCLVDIRFYVPDDEENDKDAAQLFCDAIKQNADLGSNLGDVIAAFPDLPCLVPRGRYEVDMGTTFMRFRGKTYDYKILYSSITKLFLLPKPDEVHILFVIGLDPPVRQGQTRYPFIIMQFPRDDTMEVTLNMEEDQIAELKLSKEYDAPTFEVVSTIFKGLTMKKIIVPGSFKSHHGFNAIKCSHKANEGFFYPLEKSIFFIPKPPIYMPHADIGSVEFSRVGSSSSNRSFDMKVFLKNGTDFQFSNIMKEEFSSLENYLNEKGIRFKNEISEEVVKRTTLGDMEDLSDDSSEDGDYEDEDASDESEEESDASATEDDASASE